MKKSQKKEIKKRISEEIKNTQGKITQYRELCQPIPPENSIGRVSRMDAINNKSVVEAALRETLKKIAQLQIIQKGIDDDDFGLCMKCKKQIPFGRIMIRPESKFCIDCAK